MHLLQKYDGKQNFVFTCIYLSGLHMLRKSKYPIKTLISTKLYDTCVKFITKQIITKNVLPQT